MFINKAIVVLALSNYIKGDEWGDNYAGEDFPVKYLEAEDTTATIEDVYFYLEALEKAIKYFHSRLNDTDVNRSMGSFFMRNILGRTLLESKSKIPKECRDKIVGLIRMGDEVLSHYVYDVMQGPRRMYLEHDEYRFAMFFKEKDVIEHSIGDFERNRLRKWILNKGKINEYIRVMDAATLPKEKYIEIVDDSYSTHYILIKDSDKCLSRLVYNIQPSHKEKTLHICRNDPHCFKSMHSSPSVSYGLSHRLLNIMLYRYARNCYWLSPEADQKHMDILCAFMYREAVYLARRGYFARDIFLEHIALCGVIGYEEFFRKHWFKKAISWMNDNGCIQESRNFGINRTRRFIRDFPEMTQTLLNSLKESLHDECHPHPMALLITVLAHAVRYSLFKLPMLG